jgi:protein SCO1/2
MTGWWIGILPGLLVFTNVNADEPSSFSNQCATNLQTFAAKGVVKELKADGRTAVIKHAAISNYMDAMTMPFEAKEPKELAGLQPGDEISFRLQVTETESWIDRISKIGTVALEANQHTARHPLLDYKFTNELGQAVSLGEFRGQALAITFFFTRCPVPNFCPRLSKNFQEASQKLSALTGAPTNWHFLSVSFDTEFDTPAVLKVYGESYHYDSKHWNFLTGQPEKIRELARLSGVEIENDGALFNHNFRTMIIDGGGRLQMTFPIGGNLSDAIVGEILKASAVTDGSVAP